LPILLMSTEVWARKFTDTPKDLNNASTPVINKLIQSQNPSRGIFRRPA